MKLKVCPDCGNNAEGLIGYIIGYRTSANMYQLVKCPKCNGIGKIKINNRKNKL